MMKSILLIALVLMSLGSCKLFVKSAAKYWTKQQISEFTKNCEANAGKIMNDDNAKDYCECAIDKVAKKYQNYEDVKKTNLREVLEVAKDCKK